MIITSKSNSQIASLIELLPRGRETTTRVLRSIRKQPYLWDPWILKDDDVYRLFYLNTPKPDRSVEFWTQGTICGAVSTDLRNWKSTGIVLEPEPKNSWEAGRMLAGNTYKEDGIYYLFYSAAGKGDSLCDEKIALATSIDGINWKRDSSDPLLSDADRSLFYGGQVRDFLRFHWRDPYILKDENTGKYYMFISTYSKNGHINRYQACIGLAVADKLSGPYQVLPPVAGPNISGIDIEKWPFSEMERPQIIYRNGKYHLFFSCWPWELNPAWTKKFSNYRFKESSLYWFISDKITGPFKPVADIPVVKGSEKTGMYGINFLPSADDPEELWAIGWHHRLITLQVLPLFKAIFNGDRLEIANNKL